MHNRALENVMHAPMLFFDSNPTGRILNRFSKDLDEGIPFYKSFSFIIVLSIAEYTNLLKLFYIELMRY